VNRGQLKLPGWERLEEQWAAEKAVADKKRQERQAAEHEKWAASILRNMVENYPPTAEECDIMLSGIRIDRFVSHLECEGCNFATEDHTVGWMFLTKVCLKDYYSLRHRLGLRK